MPSTLRWGFFIAFLTWFAIAPQLSWVRTAPGLNKEKIQTLVSVVGTIFMRFVLGPGCDKFGARILFAVVLCSASPKQHVPSVTNNTSNNKNAIAVFHPSAAVAKERFRNDKRQIAGMLVLFSLGALVFPVLMVGRTMPSHFVVVMGVTGFAMGAMDLAVALLHLFCGY